MDAQQFHSVASSIALNYLPLSVDWRSSSRDTHAQQCASERGTSKTRGKRYRVTILPEPSHQVFRPQVRIALQHLKRLVSGDGRDFHRIEPLLEEA